jgi:hypothetical protein
MATPIPGLLSAIHLVDVALAVVGKALTRNPSLGDKRALNQHKLRLNAERSVLQAEFDAAIAGHTGVQGPGSAAIAEIDRLTAIAEAATRSAISASQAIKLGTDVLGLATEVVAPG